MRKSLLSVLMKHGIGKIIIHALFRQWMQAPRPLERLFLIEINVGWKDRR